MSAPSGSDRSLLDRLNALKPSSISLAGPPQTLNTLPASSAAAAASAPLPAAGGASLEVGGTSAEPVTREDALAARLKTLRQARDEDNGRPETAPPETATSSESAAEGEGKGRPEGDRKTEQISSEQADEGDEEDDPLFLTGDQAVNDLLMELAAEGMGEEDAEVDDIDGADLGDDDLIPLPDVPAGNRLGESSSEGEDEGEDHSRQVEDLLKSLAGTTIRKDDDEGPSTPGGDGDAGDADDSDGDDMGREVRRVLAQARDEAALAKQDEQEEKDEDEDIVTGPRDRDSEQEDEDILQRDHLRRKKENDDGGKDDDNPLGLPAVPTKLVDPPPSLPEIPKTSLPQKGKKADGDDDISARLAALRGLRGAAAGLGQTDAFGLPSAPTFRPGEEEGGVLKRGHFGHGRRNYTDADQQTWCVVCLEDAAVRCLGCAEDGGADQNNAYCARCWHEMHVGPAAGFDERGHKRVPLVR